MKNVLAQIKAKYEMELPLNMPLVGDPTLVERATPLRHEIWQKALEGLVVMGEEGLIWASELYDTFSMFTAAKWWIDEAPRLLQMEKTVFVQVLCFTIPIPGVRTTIIIMP